MKQNQNPWHAVPSVLRHHLILGAAVDFNILRQLFQQFPSAKVRAGSGFKVYAAVHWLKSSWAEVCRRVMAHFAVPMVKRTALADRYTVAARGIRCHGIRLI